MEAAQLGYIVHEFAPWLRPLQRVVSQPLPQGEPGVARASS